MHDSSYCVCACMYVCVYVCVCDVFCLVEGLAVSRVSLGTWLISVWPSCIWRCELTASITCSLSSIRWVCDDEVCVCMCACTCAAYLFVNCWWVGHKRLLGSARLPVKRSGLV